MSASLAEVGTPLPQLATLVQLPPEALVQTLADGGGPCTTVM